MWAATGCRRRRVGGMVVRGRVAAWGATGMVAALATGDGGRRWARSFTGDVTGFAASGSSAWAAVTACHQGAAAPVCRTTVVDTRDSGATWQPAVAMGFPRTAGGWQPSHLAPASATTAALVEMFGNSTVGTAGVYVTTDGGASWQLTRPLLELPVGGTTGATVDFVTADLGWLAVPGRRGGPRGQLLETTDGGVSWHLVPDRADVTGLGRGR